MTGWIKLHRKIRENPVFNNPKLLRLWLICLTEANYAKGSQLVGNQIVELEPGQFVTGRFDIFNMYNDGLVPSERVKGEKTVYRWLDVLVSNGFLTMKSTNKYTVVTVANWELYQSTENEKTNKRPTNDQQMTTKEELKELKEKDLKHKSSATPSDDDYKNAELLLELRSRKMAPPVKPNMTSWANDFRIVREKYKHSDEIIERNVRASQSERFFQSDNIRSASKFKKKYEDIHLFAEKQSQRGNGSNVVQMPYNRQQVLDEYIENIKKEQGAIDYGQT